MGYPEVTVRAPVVATFVVPNSGDGSRSSLISRMEASFISFGYAGTSLRRLWVYSGVLATHSSQLQAVDRHKLSKVGGAVTGGDGTNGISVPGVPLRASFAGVRLGRLSTTPT